MEAFKLETVVTDDGKIILPRNLKEIFNHKIEILLMNAEPSKNRKPKKLHIHTFKCGGKLKDFSREDIYEDRI
jgi:hypothetical protein